jgi:8-oxo-dGTP pyrophosphatase MutT (NUDIX family)
MGGAWVFPGGATKGGESPAEAGLRELEEEANLTVDGELVPFSRWITPAEIKLRFDTFFYAVEARDSVEARPDGEECVDAAWMRPADALEAFARGELELVFPTIKHLEELAESASVAAVIAAAREREVVPIQPRIRIHDGVPRAVLPGEPGFDE